MYILYKEKHPDSPVCLSATRWTPTRFQSCWWRQAKPPAGPRDPSSPCTPPTRGGCSRLGAATASSWLWPTPPLWTWTRRVASSGHFSSARCVDLRKTDRSDHVFDMKTQRLLSLINPNPAVTHGKIPFLISLKGGLDFYQFLKVKNIFVAAFIS